MTARQFRLNSIDSDRPVNLRDILKNRSQNAPSDPRVIAQKPSTTEAASLRQVPVGELQVDHTYQRPVSPTHVNRIAKGFDHSLFGIVTVSEREDGSLYILDGQHRAAALVKLGRGEMRIPCEVLTGLSLQEEAEIFHLRNSNKKTMSPQEKFRGALLSGDERAMEIERIVRNSGYEVNLDDSELRGGKIPAIAALRHVDKQYRDGHLAITLELIRDTWGTEVGPRGNLISGLAYFLFLYRDQVNRKRFINQLSQVNLDQLYREAKQHRLATGMQSIICVGSVLLRRYNYRLSEPNKMPPLEVMRAMNAMKEAEDAS